jgi:hypothetical protein
MTGHSPLPIGSHEREVAEYHVHSANFFTWAWGEYRRTDWFWDVGRAVTERLEAWEPCGKAH